MRNDQLIVIDWLENTGHEFLTDLIELEGCFESVPGKVIDSFCTLTDKEKLEVIKTAANDLFLKMS